MILRVFWVWFVGLVLGLFAVAPLSLASVFLFVPIFVGVVFSLLVTFGIPMSGICRAILLVTATTGAASSVLWVVALMPLGRSSEGVRHLALFGSETSQAVIAALVLFLLFAIGLSNRHPLTTAVPFLFGGALVSCWIVVSVLGFVSRCYGSTESSQAPVCIWHELSLFGALCSLGLALLAALRPPGNSSAATRGLFRVAVMWVLTGTETALICWWFYVISFVS